MSFISSFKRITTNNHYIPEIDGLRFVAIFSVLLHHLHAYFKTVYSGSTSNYTSLWENVLTEGWNGVELFFMISGLVLSLPFARYYIQGAKKPKLRDYYIRRLTRIEPPYILCMIFLYLVFMVMHNFDRKTLTLSLLCSLTYTHNFFANGVLFPGPFPLINGVAWTLELEVQFYVLAPLLFRIYKFKAIQRRIILVAIICIFLLLQHYITLPFICIFQKMQYFLLGILLGDLFVSRGNIKMNKGLSFIIGLLAFVGIWTRSYIGQYFPSYYTYIPILILIFLFTFGYIALFTPVWKRLLSFNLFAIIGGACYSIYLMHYPTILLFSKFIINRFNTHIYALDFILYTIISLVPVALVSGIFFKLIEQPCMNKDWPSKLKKKLYLILKH